MVEIGHISTEKSNPNTKELDKISIPEQVDLMIEEYGKVNEALIKSRSQISSLVTAVYGVIKKGGKVFYVGAGTSGRLGILDASEILPTFGEDDIFVGLIAGGKKAIETPAEKAEDDEDLAKNDLKNIGLTKHDIVIGLTASGRTPYAISAVKYASKIGAKTGSISTSKDALISRKVLYPVEAVVGPEPITGSTRMKSGSAQKSILNMISSLAMVNMGKTYGNYMVDVVATNQKLISRSVNMIMSVAGVDINTAIDFLDKAEGSVKIAIVMIRNKVSKAEAEAELNSKRGKLRLIIKD